MNYGVRVRCECGRFRFVSSDWMGNTVESCGCGFRSRIRGNPPVSESVAVFHEDGSRTDFPLCAWKGCPNHTRSVRTDFCPKHCDERKKLRDSARVAGKKSGAENMRNYHRRRRAA